MAMPMATAPAPARMRLGWALTPHATCVDGWTWSVRDRPGLGADIALALAFVLWGCAAWFRSPWSRHLGVLSAGAAIAVVAIVGATTVSGVETHLEAGYWTWLASAVALCAAFVIQQGPERPAAGESVPRDDIERGRIGLATCCGVLGGLPIALSHALLSTPNGGWMSSRVSHPLVDPGTSLVSRLGLDLHSILECLVIGSVVLFVVAIRTRWTLWRWMGAVTSLGLAAGTFARPAPWIPPHVDVALTDVLWRGPPLLLVAAFALLPECTGADAPPAEERRRRGARR
jgi:hypothetical protein